MILFILSFVSDILKWLANLVISVIDATGYIGVFLLMIPESAMIPVPSEVIMGFSGYLVYKGHFNIYLVSLMGALGNVVGSAIAYYICMKARWILDRYGKYILLSHRELAKAEKFFSKYGNLTAFICRLLPGIRTYISCPAGAFKVRFDVFLVYTFIGSYVWSFFLAYVGKILGENWHIISVYFHKFEIPIGILILLLIGWYIYHVLKSRREYGKAQG